MLKRDEPWNRGARLKLAQLEAACGGHVGRVRASHEVVTAAIERLRECERSFSAAEVLYDRARLSVGNNQLVVERFRDEMENAAAILEDAKTVHDRIIEEHKKIGASGIPDVRLFTECKSIAKAIGVTTK